MFSSIITIVSHIRLILLYVLDNSSIQSIVANDYESSCLLKLTGYSFSNSLSQIIESRKYLSLLTLKTYRASFPKTLLGK
ncbi:hypothetical protein OnM2_03268 [Erysiphe neolycopersici]|uniref:Uncharacterized protein n=1 Tax=Erysiphe neolycopersici TaxID=212602 RepID=A0A420HR68_9PEZI|nr:hypothetical protein OnM2_03268 [Erysiphe neolycopersici]